jgi:hypothetical protein
MKEIEEKVIKYFENEYKEVKEGLTAEGSWLLIPICDKVINNAIARCLGVAIFAQTCGASYSIIAPKYEEIKKKFEDLIK